MSTDTDTSAPGIVRDIALNEIINATDAAVADDVDNAVVVFWAAKLGIPLDRIQIETEGDLDVRGFTSADCAPDGVSGARTAGLIAVWTAASRSSTLGSTVACTSPGSPPA